MQWSKKLQLSLYMVYTKSKEKQDWTARKEPVVLYIREK